MRASILAELSVCVALTCVSAHSQAPATVGALQMHIEGINIPHIANAPFRAKEVVRWDEPLVGGGTVSKMYYTMVARDSQGRVRREPVGPSPPTPATSLLFVASPLPTRSPTRPRSAPKPR